MSLHQVIAGMGIFLGLAQAHADRSAVVEEYATLLRESVSEAFDCEHFWTEFDQKEQPIAKSETQASSLLDSLHSYPGPATHGQLANQLLIEEPALLVTKTPIWNNRSLPARCSPFRPFVLYRDLLDDSLQNQYSNTFKQKLISQTLRYVKRISDYPSLLSDLLFAETLLEHTVALNHEIAPEPSYPDFDPSLAILIKSTKSILPESGQKDRYKILSAQNELSQIESVRKELHELVLHYEACLQTQRLSPILTGPTLK